jgi:hypothetical protein
MQMIAQLEEERNIIAHAHIESSAMIHEEITA